MVIRVGGFHTEMSYLECIGHIMTCSVLQDVLETIYAPNAVTHMMSGKAVQRATRGHMLIENALTVLLLEKGIDQRKIDSSQVGSTVSHDIFTEDATEIEDSSGFSGCILHNTYMSRLASLYDQLGVENTTTAVNECESLQSLQALISDTRIHLCTNRTARLWMQYMNMVNLLQQFIRAKRTGNWLLHLTTIRMMLPYFAASGHNLYLKSAHIYLQNMLRLRETNPDVHEAFMTGSHTHQKKQSLLGRAVDGLGN